LHKRIDIARRCALIAVGAGGCPRVRAAKRKGPISCILLDREDGWAETWHDVDTQVKAEFRLTTGVRRVDVCDPPKRENLTKAFGADIFFAIYFLSEIHSFAGRCEHFFIDLVASMKSSAYVVPVFINFAKKLFPSKQFELIHEEKKIALRLNSDEEKKVLGPYLDIVGKHSRLGTDAAARLIWRKK
jgi:hypothetical protein